MCCNISVYLITLAILKSNGEKEGIGPNDVLKFRVSRKTFIFTEFCNATSFDWKKLNKFILISNYL